VGVALTLAALPFAIQSDRHAIGVGFAVPFLILDGSFIILATTGLGRLIGHRWPGTVRSPGPASDGAAPRVAPGAEDRTVAVPARF